MDKKNTNISDHSKKKTLCNTLNWGNWNSGDVKLGVRWAERDKFLEKFAVSENSWNHLMNSM